ncbi:MAG: carbohydrate porin [Planctomycetota bacterium]|jgi:maltoporin
MEKRILCILLIIAVLHTNLVWAADDERLANLEKKIEAMQAAYESKIDSLESRIDELEGEKAKASAKARVQTMVATVPPEEPAKMPDSIPPEPAEVTTPTISETVSTEPIVLPDPPETYSIEWMQQYANALQQIQNEQAQRIEKEKSKWGFEFHGYLRSGFGINGYGNTMSPFRAPNSGAKYRLGNESETYLETTFVSRMPEDMLEDGVTFDTQIRLAYVVDFEDSNNSDTDTSLREAFGIARGVWKDVPQAAFWAGQRFYSRYDVHMNDFYYRDMSGYGGGAEDIPIWDESALLSIALLGGSTDDLDSSGTQYDDDDYQLNMNTIDVGLIDMDMLGGKVAFYGTFSDFNGDTFTESDSGDVLELSDSTGLAANFIYDLDLSETVFNRLVLQYGQGAAANFRALMVAPTGLINNGNEKVDVDDFEKFRVLNSILLDDGSPWSYEGLLLFEEGDYGVGGDSKNRWLSAGIRPVYHFNRYWSLAFEAGLDYTDNDRGGSGTLGKLTIAPQISPKAKQLSRPVLRAFLTYAWWADDFEGSVGGSDYADDLDGVTVGLQMETWW